MVRTLWLGSDCECDEVLTLCNELAIARVFDYYYNLHIIVIIYYYNTIILSDRKTLRYEFVNEETIILYTTIGTTTYRGQ